MKAMLTAVQAGRVYLLAHQQADGQWQGFNLPVGRSDAWMTAYVGLALVAAQAALPSSTALGAGRRAASWLQSTRPYRYGWGFNGSSGADADSTAQGLWLLRAYGAVSPADAAWLYNHWQPGGGFATYLADDAWGQAHPCVTPVAFLALPLPYQAQLRSGVLAYSSRTRQPDGTWPAYWWRTCHYSTYWHLWLLNQLGIRLDRQLHPVSLEETHAVHTAFDLAHVVGILALKVGLSDLTQRLIKELLRLQRADGSWAGGDDLRVTDHRCEQPWLTPRGQLYCDRTRIFTTATVIRILSHIMEPCSSLTPPSSTGAAALNASSCPGWSPA